MLLLRRNEVVSRDQLAEGLWGNSPPATAGPTIKTYVSRLRSMLPGDMQGVRLLAQASGYRLRVESGELDLDRFESLVETGRTAIDASEAETGRQALREALALFHGAPLQDLAFAPFAQTEIGRLEELRLSAIELALEADLAAGRHAEVVGELESLVGQYPFRELLWGQLMLAMYRSGRQGDALVAFDRARRMLADELGVDPGQALQLLHRRILDQDSSLELIRADPPMVSAGPNARAPSVAEGTPSRGTATGSITAPLAVSEPTTDTDQHRRGRLVWSRRRVGVMATAVGTALALTVVALLLPRTSDPQRESSTSYRPGTALIDLTTGALIHHIPPNEIAVSAYPIAGGGRFWVNDWSPNAYVEIDPRTGEIARQITPPARDPSVTQDFSTVTPFAVEGRDLWVIAGDDLVRMDTTLGKEADRVHLDELGQGSGLAEGVAIGGGSVWVSRDVGRGQVLRLTSDGRLQHVWNDITPYLNLSYGDGSLWIADERGLARIDPQTRLVIHAGGIQGNCPGGGGGCVVAGGGFGWTSDGTKGLVYKVAPDGHIAATYSTGIGTGFMSFADGILWVANSDDGTVSGIDAVTGETTSVFRFGHPIWTMAARDGVLLVDLGQGVPIDAHIDALSGTVAKFFANPGELRDEEPALNTDPAAYQIEFATCAKLLNYPDAPAPAGLRLRPEVAAAMPTISADRRTYTFTVRAGYRFSPPSNEPLTAETFRYSIERTLSPELARGPTVAEPPGPLFIDDIAGELAFREGEAKHISGLRATGNTLSITLTRPSPDFLERLALPYFCPVPQGTPFVAGAPHEVGANGEEFIVSAGPYYVADYENGVFVILKRNPNYVGSREPAFDAIAIREGADASAALDDVQNGGWDGITSLFDPAMQPGGPVDQRWGELSSVDPNEQRYFLTPMLGARYLAFNSEHGIFADPTVRRAAALAIHRRTLAAAWGTTPSDQVLSPAFRGYVDRNMYPLSASTAKARSLMDGRSGNALMPISSDCDACAATARIVQRDLAAIGIDVAIRKFDDLDAAIRSGVRFDLLDTRSDLPYPDPATFLSQMLRDIPPGWLSEAVSAEVRDVAALTGHRRTVRAAGIADRLALNEVPFVPYGTPQTPQFLAPRLGCQVFTSVGYGVDLAALCLQPS
jgi:ABC-type oligopeptide transport system substrate-binding subunit/DNA-binding SARP family transcriptional activator